MQLSIANSMQRILASAFVSSAAVVLLITGAAKIFSAISGGQILENLDPVFGITLYLLFWCAGAIEILASLVCMFGQRLGLKAALVLWLATNFVVYRIGLMWVGGICGCLGTLAEPLHLSPATVDASMKIVLAYLVIGSVATLFFLHKDGRSTVRTPPNDTAEQQSELQPS